MNDIERKYFERCKDIIPFDTGNSLHVSHEYYNVNDKVVELYYVIGEMEPFEIAIYDKEGYKTPYEKLQETLKLISKRLKDE